MTGWTYERARDALDSHVNYEALVAGRIGRPNLERISRFMRIMADPQDQYPVIHLTGTNGKTSTACILSSLLGAAGLSVGRFTSPDLGRVNERMSLNDEPIGDEDFAEAVGAVVDLESMLAPDRLTWFEVLAASAYRWFSDVPVNVAVVEVGMLGMWDATNVAHGRVAVVTNVGLDHLGAAGPTRLDVAREKAGIIKPGSTLILGDTDPALAHVFSERSPGETWRRDVDFLLLDNRVAVGGRFLSLKTPGAVYGDVFLPLHGAHQGENAVCALAAAEAFFGAPLEADLVEEGFASARSPGRLEVVGRRPLVVLDGAHNPDGAAALAAALAEEFDDAARRTIVIGALRGHDLASTVDALGLTRDDTVVVCAPSWPRAVPVEEVAEVARRSGASVTVIPSVSAAVVTAVDEAGEDDLVIVTGSLYVVGEAREALGVGP